MKKLLQSLFLLLFIAFQAIAQERTVTGTVTDKTDGLPLPGVSVKVKGSNIGTSTGGNGQFSLTVPSGSNTLTFTFVGYTTQDELIINDNDNINVVKEAISNKLKVNESDISDDVSIGSQIYQIQDNIAIVSLRFEINIDTLIEKYLKIRNLFNSFSFC